jgi:serine protease Do
MLLSLWTTRWRVLLVTSCLSLAASMSPVLAEDTEASSLRRTAIVRAVDEARPSVVNIHGRKTVRDAVTAADARQVNGMGTGVVIDERGYIVTNYHVVEGVARIQVTLHDETELVAQLIAHDPKTDLAIIKITTDKELPVIKTGTSRDLMAGEPVIAVGNAFGYTHTVTRGIISALHRTVQVSDEQKYLDLIQTDASINPGNSGGPLLNIDGEMIGINVAVRVGAQGIGFAIPIDEAMEVTSRLLNSERLAQVSHGVIGKTTFEENTARFVVSAVRKDSAAEKCGLAPGDIVLAAGESKIVRSLDFERAMLGHKAGEEVAVTVQRNEEQLTIGLILESATRGTLARASTEKDPHWETLGVKLALMNGGDFRQLNSKYRGGLKVLSVREDSPAARQGIRAGDVLVGMHIWETVSFDNLNYILNREDFVDLQPIKFYIVRGQETLFGHMRVAGVTATAAQ